MRNFALTLAIAGLAGALPAAEPLPGIIPQAARVPTSTAASAQPLATLAPAAPPTASDPVATLSGDWRATVEQSKQGPEVGLDLMLGMQTGIRPNVGFALNERSAVVVEGFYGALLTKFGASEGGGAGLRWVTTRGGSDAVTFGPGVDVLFNFDDGKAAFIAPTIDLAWRHCFGQRAGLVLGVNAGVGVGISGREDDSDGKKVTGKVTPLISFYSGLRY